MKNRHVFSLVIPAAALFVIIFFIPFVFLITKSFQGFIPGSLFSDPSFTLANYAEIFRDNYYVQIYMRTVRISVVSTAVVLLLSYPLSMYICSLKPNVRGFLMTLIILPMIGGAMIQTMGWFAMLMRYGTVNSILTGLHIIKEPINFLGSESGVVIGLVQSFLPIMVYPLVSSLLAIDHETIESARTLGAKPPRVFFTVIIPLSAPGAMAGSLLVFMACLTSFVTPSSLGQGKIQVFGTFAYQQAMQVMNWPFASAFSIFFILAMVSVYFILQYFSKKLR